MKKIFKKITSLFLLMLLATTVVTSQQASARVRPSSSSWDMTFIQVGSGVPYNSIYKFVDKTTTEFYSPYKLTTNCVMVTYKVTSNCANRWIWIDEEDQKGVLCDYTQSGDYSYLTYAIPNVAPGTHTLQLRVGSPDYFSSEMKNHYMTIVVPDKKA